MKTINGIEVEVVNEIWRTDKVTLYVVYPATGTAYIKGMRGCIDNETLTAITDTLKSKGVETLLFERKKKGIFRTVEIDLS